MKNRHLIKFYLAILTLAMLLALSACDKKSEDEFNATSLEMARILGHGINLYNTMEACNYYNRIPNREPSVYETMWGQPITTQEIITGMREAGFRTLRIPVAWTNAMDFENGDLIINEAYLDRVEEIINYGLNADMFVVVNAHWDHGWWSLFGHADQAWRDYALNMFISMWTQISERYKEYDHRLLFEAANEEWGNRFNDDTRFSPGGGTLTESERYELVTSLGQVFVDLVRASGGNNAKRYLLMPGYCTDVVKTVDDRFKMPVDPQNRLLLKVHYYTPWSYSGGPSSVAEWGTQQEIEHMNNLLGSLTKYTDMGYGIIFGEWGVLDNEGPDRLTFTTNFLDNADLYGFATLLWATPDGYCRIEKRIIDSDVAALFKDRDIALDTLSTEEIIKRAGKNMDLTHANAADRYAFILSDDEAIAWLMFVSNDWGLSYSVGNEYNPLSKTAGIIATDASITGEGTYTVALDFTGTNDGFATNMFFSAIGITNGEALFPGYCIELTEILVNGEKATLSGRVYTTEDDNSGTTRANLYNDWVGSLPSGARTASGNLTGVNWNVLEHYTDMQIRTISVTFKYVAP